MKVNKKEIIERIKKFVFKRYILLIIVGGLLFSIIGFGGMVTYNQSSSFCLKCHYNKGTYFAIDFRIPSHQGINKGESPGCVVCHPDKAIEIIFFRNLKKSKNFSQRAANLQFEEIIDSKDTYKTEECLKCHPEKLDVMVREPYLLADEQLREIGLKLNKKLHHRFEKFLDQDQQLYEELSTRASLTEEERQELVLLEKIRAGNCGQCHIQKKLLDGSSTVDKQVNYIARNPISCAGCHENTSSLIHPGKPMKRPTKEVCQKCHHGKIHGKFLIFKADCEEQKDIEHCVKCHPSYNKSEINFTMK